MKRRDFLKSCSLMLAGSYIPNVMALESPSSKEPNILLIMLRGGADSLNMLVPYSDEFYQQKRSTIGLGKNDCKIISPEFGINEVLENSFYNNFIQKQAVFIPLAGQINNSRSHFQAQDVMEYGINNITKYESGFLGRLQEVIHSKVISFTNNITPICKSSKLVIPNVGLNSITTLPEEKIRLIENNYQNDFKRLLENIKDTQKITNKLNKNMASEDSFEIKMKRAAEFMNISDYKIGFIDFDGWDTHANQGKLDGQLPQLLSSLDLGLVAFKDTLREDIWNNTVVIIMSEFGRTLKQNDNGTEHGHGGLLTIMGGLIKKSGVLGDWNLLTDKNLHENRDLPVLYENRDVLAEIFTHLYSLNKNQANYIFPDYKLSGLNISNLI